MNTSFQYPVAINAQEKYTNMSLERRLASGILSEIIKNVKGCAIQSIINISVHYECYGQVDKINDFEEQVDARNWLKNNSSEQVDHINDSNKQVDSISDYE